MAQSCKVRSENMSHHRRSGIRRRKARDLPRSFHTWLSCLDLVGLVVLDPCIALIVDRGRPLDPVLSTRYIQNSLAVDSDEMRTIQECASRNGIVVSLGFSENDNNSVYIAQAIIDSDGKILMNRRKLKATHMERTIFGDASGKSLINVAATGSGARIGTLACWEHAQPLLKYNTMTQREDIHCAAWPPIVSHQGGPDLWSLSKEGEYSKTLSVIIRTDENCQAA